MVEVRLQFKFGRYGNSAGEITFGEGRKPSRDASSLEVEGYKHSLSVATLELRFFLLTRAAIFIWALLPGEDSFIYNIY